MLRKWMARMVTGHTSVGSPLDAGDRPDPSFEANWRRHMKTRLLLVLGLLAVWAVALEARLVFLQVVSHDELTARARLQQQGVVYPEAGRGDILDRNGEVLAYSVEGTSLVADPSLIEDAAADAADICAALGDCSAGELTEVADKLRGRGRYVMVRPARLVSPDAVMRIEALKSKRSRAGRPLPVTFSTESLRWYPKLDLASHVIGFVNAAGQGAAGIEAKYNSLIAGAKGRVLVQVDGRRNHELGSRVERAPTAGATLELTIDLGLQHIAERELRAGVEAFHAAGGSVIIQNPLTGEILAEASYPTFNPNAYLQFPEDARRNRAATDTYEPGSTFKIVTASAALNENVLSPSDIIDCGPGVITFPGRTIGEAKGHNYGLLSLENVLIKSSNIGAIRIGQRVRADRMMQYVRRFGFLQTLSPDFAGESRGTWGGLEVDDSALASLSMGYQISVTPIQIASAASVVANGGLLMEPRVLRAVVRDGRREQIEPRILRRVITPETAATMTAIMEGVVERGTASAAALSRYQVAGKTGTAKKVVKGRYSDTDYNVSFVGFVPSRQPALTILVVIDTPRNGSAYGGTVAAPIFKRVAEAAMQYLGLTPSINPAPPLVAAVNRGLVSRPAGNAEMMPTITRVGGRAAMPDLRGMSLRDALRVTNALGLSMATDGDGVVVFQTPAPGEFVAPDGIGALQLRRLPGRSER